MRSVTATPLLAVLWFVLSRMMSSASNLLQMDVEKTITDIETLEQIYALLDTRPMQSSDREAANQRHDTMYANNPWFRLWQRYGR